MTEPATPHVLVVTSSGAPASATVPVLAAIEAAGMRLRAIDVGGAGGGGESITDRVKRALLGESAERRLRKELETSPPDVAVAFDPHATLALTVARDQVTSPAPVVAVIADLDPVSEWRQTDADRFLCVDEPAAVALAELGIEADRVLVVGPIGERAYADAGMQERGALRSRFQLAGTPVVIEAAGLGAEAVGQIVMQLSLVAGAERMHFLFDAAGDADVAAVLRRQVPALGLRAKLFGATSDAPLLWRAADLVVGRPRPQVISRALLVGARLVAIVDDAVPGGGRVVAALEARRRAIAARNLLLVSGAIEAALGGAAPPPSLDGADNIADVVWAVAGDKRGVIDERHAAARAATSERVRAARAGAEAAARVTAMPGELEDLGGDGVPLSAAASGAPDAGELDRLRTEVRGRIAELTRSMMASRADADRHAKEGDTARADAARARMHALLGELAKLESELKDLDRVKAAPRPSAPPSAGVANDAPPPPRPPRSPSVDDALADLKRRSAAGGGAAPPPKPSSSASSSSRQTSAVDSELAALKQKMAQAKKKGS
jgi:hypothetical protein